MGHIDTNRYPCEAEDAIFGGHDTESKKFSKRAVASMPACAEGAVSDATANVHTTCAATSTGFNRGTLHGTRCRRNVWRCGYVRSTGGRITRLPGARNTTTSNARSTTGIESPAFDPTTVPHKSAGQLPAVYGGVGFSTDPSFFRAPDGWVASGLCGWHRRAAAIEHRSGNWEPEGSGGDLATCTTVRNVSRADSRAWRLERLFAWVG